MKQFSNITKLFLVLFMCAIASCTSENKTETSEAVTNSDKAPDFEVTTIDGEIISLEKSLEEGKPLVVYFTASWCPTCAKNWPVLSEVYPEFEDELTLVAISIDPTDTEEVMRNLAEEKNFAFPSTEGNPQIMMDFGVAQQATTVGVDLDGNIVFKKTGQALSAEEFRELFTGLLN
jgi:peroxiredoxin